MFTPATWFMLSVVILDSQDCCVLACCLWWELEGVFIVRRQFKSCSRHVYVCQYMSVDHVIINLVVEAIVVICTVYTYNIFKHVVLYSNCDSLLSLFDSFKVDYFIYGSGILHIKDVLEGLWLLIWYTCICRPVPEKNRKKRSRKKKEVKQNGWFSARKPLFCAE